MSHETVTRLQPGRWIAMILVPLVLYVGSFGPVSALMNANKLTWLSVETASRLYAPMIWYVEHMENPRPGPLTHYVWWCRDRLLPADMTPLDVPERKLIRPFEGPMFPPTR